MSVFTKVLKAGEGKKVRRLAEIVPFINDLEPEMEALSDDDLRHMTVEFRERLDRDEELDDLLVEAFAVVREASWRVLGQRHFDVQMMGGMALHFGWIAEMKTGEGKTLVSTLPVYLNALAGQGVHLVTVNDYLATRDSEWMGRVYRWLGLEVGRVGPDIADFAEKRKAYAADITYGTNTEFGFDYLRDNMMPRRREDMVQRGHIYAIIDEVDSILIDEARTPLIISGPSDEAAKLYYQFAAIARSLGRDADYEVDEEKRSVVPLESGIDKVETAVGVSNLYDSIATNYVHQLIKALEAKELYHRDKDYLVADGEVKIIDEFTGRTLEGRRWSDGLHQAVEAKERVRINEENHTWATVTIQNYFRLYEKLAGMTGTAETEAAEFASTYKLNVVPIPTNRPMVRTDEADLIFKSEEAKFDAVVGDIVERHEGGQPVLVGTASVAKSEVLSRLLDRRGIPHQVLNAKQHFREAEVVAQAGRIGAVTVATNMAGRGVDIILGGNAEKLTEHETMARSIDFDTEEGRAEAEKLRKELEEQCERDAETVREAGGLYVLGSERHESRRIDNQLRGRSGRQGDPGESRFYLSLEDDLMRLFATGAVNWVMGRALPDDVPIEAKMVTKAIERAQNTVEGRNSEIRKDVLKYDEVMNEQRQVIYKRRLQIMDGEDLQERTQELLESTVEILVRDACPSDYPEEWDLDHLLAEVGQYYPTKFTTDDLAEAATAGQVVESLVAEALEFYDQHSTEINESFADSPLVEGDEEPIRQVERDVMLQIMDQRWREHLAEMDYLREGINLRAMGQQDPLVAWQREGFSMFGQLMEAIDDDYLRYILHAERVVEPAPEPDLGRATYEAADDPVTGTIALAGQLLADQGVAVAGQSAASAVDLAAPEAPAPSREARRREARQAARTPPEGQASGNGAPKTPAPAAKAAGQANQAANQKVGRNEPCWCGSGKKFKLCHGRA